MMPVAEGVRHLEDVAVDGVVVADVRGEVPLEAVLRLGQRLVEMGLHHRPHRRLRPRVGIGGVQEVGDLVGVGVPGRARLADRRLIAGLRGLQQGNRTEDVLLEQRRQALAGGARRSTA